MTVSGSRAELTDEQVPFFQTFGFLVRRGLFDPTEVAAISREFDRLMREDRRGEPFAGQRRHFVCGFAEKSPFFTRIVEDDRIYKTVERLLGSGFAWLCSEGNMYSGDTGWHPDRSRFDYPPMKVAFYLDPLTTESGCLRVIPGSHRQEFHEQLTREMTSHQQPGTRPFGLDGRDLPCYPLACQPGDVFFLNMNTWHAAYGGASGRRHIALNFVPSPTAPRDYEVWHDIYNLVKHVAGQLQYQPTGRAFTDEFLHSESPRIRAITARWLELRLE